MVKQCLGAQLQGTASTQIMIIFQQLFKTCSVDQYLSFHCIDGTISFNSCILLKNGSELFFCYSEVKLGDHIVLRSIQTEFHTSSSWTSSVVVQPGLVWSETFKNTVSLMNWLI